MYRSGFLEKRRKRGGTKWPRSAGRISPYVEWTINSSRAASTCKIDSRHLTIPATVGRYCMPGNCPLRSLLRFPRAPPGCSYYGNLRDGARGKYVAANYARKGISYTSAAVSRLSQLPSSSPYVPREKSRDDKKQMLRLRYVQTSLMSAAETRSYRARAEINPRIDLTDNTDR